MIHVTRSRDVPGSSADVPVLIVGAGPTGLTLANVLAQAGVAFRIIDHKHGPVTESRAVVMHAKTLELLDKLGLADRAVAGGERVGAIEIIRDGRPVGTASFFESELGDRTPYPFAVIFEQAKTERLLLQGLEETGHGVEWGTSLRSLERLPHGARAVVRKADGEEEVVAAGWLVGADGAHSAVRHALGLGFAGETYEQVLFLADLELDWDIPGGRAEAEITRHGFLLFFPMPGDRHYRLLGALPPELARNDAITSADVQSILDRFSALGPRITATSWTSVYRTHHRMTERFRVGRVFLTGDAAHIHSPAGGQGMNTGIGDAFNLGWKLALVAKGEAHERLLDSYESERVPFARAILGGSDRGFKLLDTTNPFSQEIKLLAIPLLFSAVSRMTPLRNRLFWLVSQLWTTYRDSPIVAESGPVGRLPRAGDRAPYGYFESGPGVGTSLFAGLVGPDHHLLLFEGPRPDTATFAAARDVVAGLLAQFAAPIAIHPVGFANRALHERYGADVPSMFLIRPDGHIAFRGDATDVVPLARYLDRWFVRRARREPLQRELPAELVAS